MIKGECSPQGPNSRPGEKDQCRISIKETEIQLNSNRVQFISTVVELSRNWGLPYPTRPHPKFYMYFGKCNQCKVQIEHAIIHYSLSKQKFVMGRRWSSTEEPLIYLENLRIQALLKLNSVQSQYLWTRKRNKMGSRTGFRRTLLECRERERSK